MGTQKFWQVWWAANGASTLLGEFIDMEDAMEEMAYQVLLEGESLIMRCVWKEW